MRANDISVSTLTVMAFIPVLGILVGCGVRGARDLGRIQRVGQRI